MSSRLVRRTRRFLRQRPRANDPLVIIDTWDASQVVFEGYHDDVQRLGDDYTCLRFKPLGGVIDLANIHVEDRLRGHGVAERLVRAVSEAHPGLPMAFSGTNGYSRRLARKLATRIPHFDPRPDDQASHYDVDRAAGFYDDQPPRVPTTFAEAMQQVGARRA